MNGTRDQGIFLSNWSYFWSVVYEFGFKLGWRWGWENTNILKWLIYINAAYNIYDDHKDHRRMAETFEAFFHCFSWQGFF